LKGRHFSPDAEVIAAAETRPGWTDKLLILFIFYFISLFCGLQKLEQRAKKRVALRGEHVE
jgi:hypothetical protein